MHQANFLIIAYNKPTLLKNLLEKISRIDNSSVYIHLDGSDAISKDFHNNLACKEIIHSFLLKHPKWQFKTSEKNLGGKYGVISAINWFFNYVSEGFIIEEDIDFSPGILEFVNNYKDNLIRPDFFALCFFNPLVGLQDNILLNHWLPWGWYTSRDKWDFIKKDVINDIFVYRNRENVVSRRYAVRFYLNSIIQKVKNGKVKTWDAQVHAAVINYKFLCLFPSFTLTQHLGIGEGATHADEINWWEHLKINDYSISQTIAIGDNYNRKFEKIWRMSLSAIFSNFIFHIFFLVKDSNYKND